MMSERKGAIGAALAAIAISAGLSGCVTTGPRAPAIPRSEANAIGTAQEVVILSMRQVQLDGTSGMIGTGAGAAVGAIAGSTVGTGKGSLVGTILGGVLGGAAGSAMERGIGTVQGVELTARDLRTGAIVVVAQEDMGEGFRPGERVMLVRRGGIARISR